MSSKSWKAEHPSQQRAYSKKWQHDHPEAWLNCQIKSFTKNYSRYGKQKYWCRYLCHTAIKLGLLNRPEECEGCGEASKLAAHHENYQEPLRVVFLCRQCHNEADLKLGLVRKHVYAAPLSLIQLEELFKLSDLGFNQCQIAKMLGIDNSTVSRRLRARAEAETARFLSPAASIESRMKEIVNEHNCHNK